MVHPGSKTIAFHEHLEVDVLLQRQRSPRFVPPACRWGDVGTHFPVPNWWLDLTPILESHLMRFFDSLSKTRKSSICQERLNFLVPAFTFRLNLGKYFCHYYEKDLDDSHEAMPDCQCPPKRFWFEKKHIAVPRSPEPKRERMTGAGISESHPSRVPELRVSWWRILDGLVVG